MSGEGGVRQIRTGVLNLTLATGFRGFHQRAFRARRSLARMSSAVFGPGEGLWFGVVLQQVAVDGGLQVIGAGEPAAPDAL